MRNLILPGLAGIALFVCGCATSSPIQEYGDSQSSFKNPPELISHDYPESSIYRIYHRAATGFVSIQSIRQAAELRASSFASQQGMDFVVLGERISEPPYIMGNFPRIEVVFALIDKKAAAPPSNERDKYSDLTRLKQLLDDGALTQDEYDREKAVILNQK
jgi:hypothetical protein